MRIRTISLSFLISTALVLTAVAPTQLASAAPPVPSVVAALGDSITRGYNACGWYTDCVSRSWATGSDAGVNSHATRIDAAGPAGVETVNSAVTGQSSGQLAAQATAAVAHHPDYVTIMIGANDACRDTEEQMTPVATYRANIDAGLSVMAQGAPDALLFVASVPDLSRLHSIGEGSLAARAAWNLLNICQSMLAHPTSTAQADVERRTRVHQRVADYNAQLAEACVAYGARCRYDGGAVFNAPFELKHISHWDYFHPSAAGQALLADVTYRAGFGW